MKEFYNHAYQHIQVKDVECLNEEKGLGKDKLKQEEPIRWSLSAPQVKFRHLLKTPRKYSLCHKTKEYDNQVLATIVSKFLNDYKKYCRYLHMT